MGTGLRNIPAALVVSVQNFKDPNVSVMVLVTTLVGILILLPAARLIGRHQAGTLSGKQSHRQQLNCHRTHRSRQYAPRERHAASAPEFDLLDRTLEKFYLLPEDLALARIPDSQGLGGSTDIKSPKWVT